jgi:hypothetical protein
MPKRKKSKKRALSKSLPIIVVTLTSAEKKKAVKSINDCGKVGFQIEEIQDASIPVVRGRNHPVQRDPGG